MLFRSVDQVNTTLVQTYWHIGQRLVEFEQDGNEKAEYEIGRASCRERVFPVV